MLSDYRKSLIIPRNYSILPPMKKSFLNALNSTGRAFRTATDAIESTGYGGRFVARNLTPWLLALTPAVFAAYALTEVGKWVFDELARQQRLREPHPASPSLRGTPVPEDISAPWSSTPRTLPVCLRLGSRLADLDPTLDRSLIREELPNGKTVIRARKGGTKGWLDDHRVSVGYSTVMRYKKLVQRLRQVLSLDDRLPLEWLLDGVPTETMLPADLATPFASARRRLAKILHENPTLAALSRFVEGKLGINRLVTVRKVAVRRRQVVGGKSRNMADFSVISRGRRVNISPERVEATKGAMARVLAATNLSGKALELQNRVAKWLAGVAAERPSS